MKGTVRYSEAFKRQVVEQIGRGQYRSAEHARRAYGIRGAMTVWLYNTRRPHTALKYQTPEAAHSRVA